MIERRTFLSSISWAVLGTALIPRFGLSQTTQESTAAQIFTEAHCLDSPRFPPKLAMKTYMRVVNCFQELAGSLRTDIVLAFGQLLDTIADPSTASADSTFNALFNLKAVLDDPSISPMVGGTLLGTANAIFCSLVCAPQPTGGSPGFKYILTNWFLSDFEFDGCRVEVTCFYTCEPI
jgi:hypothetical protein